MTEDAFLAALFARLPTPPSALVVPPGDDCAGIDLGDGRWLLVAVDQVVGDRHFVHSGPTPTPAALVGRKLLARNLSDIAAMGGVPTYCLLSGAFGPDCGQDWLQDFYQGLLDLALHYGVAMIGGDLARAPADTVVSLTILGEVAAGMAVCRAGALAGDELWVTGSFGDSFPSGHHLTFEPRCAEGAWLARGGYAHAMMDVSDGLLLDATRLCRASAVGLVLDTEAIPRRGPKTHLRAALCDGEDYELLVAVPSALAARLAAEWPFATPFRRVGVFAAGPVEVRDQAGTPLGRDGYDHFGGGHGA
jgi:thiamine-monophosphate kinase